MKELTELFVQSPTIWTPVAPNYAQSVMLAQYSLNIDEIRSIVLNWRALAKDYARDLPGLSPFPGSLSSVLKQINSHLPLSQSRKIPNNFWIKNDSELPISHSVSDRGILHAMLCLISDAMVADGLSHVGQPLKQIYQAEGKAWLNQHQLMLSGPVNDLIAAGKICKAIGLNAAAVRRTDMHPQQLAVMLECGLRLTEAMTDADVNNLKRNFSRQYPNALWLETTESMAVFKGHACAALELRHQLFLKGIDVKIQPLLVFLSGENCLAAAGIARGLKAAFGNNVRLVLVEDTHHLHALPSLCRWPRESNFMHPVGYSEIGVNALIGIIDSVITVDGEHRDQLLAQTSQNTECEYSDGSLNLFVAAKEYLGAQGIDRTNTLLWMSS